MAQRVKPLPAMQDTQVRSLVWEDPLEKEMETHSSTLAWKIPWAEKPGGLQSMGSQRVGHDWATSLTSLLCYQRNRKEAGLGRGKNWTLLILSSAGMTLSFLWAGICCCECELTSEGGTTLSRTAFLAKAILEEWWRWWLKTLFCQPSQQLENQSASLAHGLPQESAQHSSGAFFLALSWSSLASRPGKASLSFTISQSLLKLMFIESMIFISPCHPLSPHSPPAFNLSQHQGLFQWVGSLHQLAKVLELQHQSFQWIFRIYLLYDWLVWSSCSPRDSQESPPASQFKSINSPALSLLYEVQLSHPYMTTGKTIDLTI